MAGLPALASQRASHSLRPPQTAQRLGFRGPRCYPEARAERRTVESVDGGHVTTPAGYRASGVTAGIKPSGRPDLALIVSDRPAAAAGVFTTNRVRAYNVDRNRHLLSVGRPLRAIVVNSGNANVATGAQGRADTDAIAAGIAERLGIQPTEVAVAQTGVIGRPLPMEPLRAAFPSAVAELGPAGGLDAAIAICTTDTHPKHTAVRCELEGVTVTLGAIAKGAGMIHPNMATLLCFVTTDAAVAPAPLQHALEAAVGETLNCISIDGDQSTSDTCLLLANGAAGNPLIDSLDDPRLEGFAAALTAVLDPLAAQIAADGEGATRLIRVEVEGALTASEARLAARAVAASNLLKCAVKGCDPNWGRIACAVGYSGAAVDQDRLTVTLNGVTLLYHGEPCGFDAAEVSRGMAAETVRIGVHLNLGEARGHAYGCDLTEEYVHINADYTT
ncbi:MAG: bifunctional glutamate N-acetyltransferase/amino-acid acetyltransferase ArgJ [Armatimonadetes bacterium]|nr:bifunctional glutamate N-acetyltransferase/amino-acid acetyltransferase ArgJ [Armatimonadota bacterium]